MSFVDRVVSETRDMLSPMISAKARFMGYADG